MKGKIEIRVTVNGEEHHASVGASPSISRLYPGENLDLTGTHVGCEHGICGACTVLMNGDSVRACLTLAVQADGAEVETVESLGDLKIWGRSKGLSVSTTHFNAVIARPAC